MVDHRYAGSTLVLAANVGLSKKQVGRWCTVHPSLRFSP